MPSLFHEALVELFRRHGELAPELLRRAAQVELPHARVEVAESELTQIVPTEYRADAVIKLYAADGRLTAAVIVEVQLRKDADKRFTWPLYITALRAKLRCPVYLLVLAEQRSVAAWANAPIALGQLGFTLRPTVLAFDELPTIIDDEAARRPELAVLSAIAHADLQAVVSAISTIETSEGLPEPDKKLYIDLILSRLPRSLRERMESQMLQDHEEYALIRGTFDRMLERVAQRRLLQDGRGQGLQTAVLALARAKLGTVSGHEQAAITAITDAPALLSLVTALGVTASAEEARAVLDAAVHRG